MASAKFSEPSLSRARWTVDANRVISCRGLAEGIHESDQKRNRGRPVVAINALGTDNLDLQLSVTDSEFHYLDIGTHDRAFQASRTTGQEAVPHTNLNHAHAPYDSYKKALEISNRILESTLDSVDSAEQIAVELAERAGFRGIDLEKIGLAVHEVVTNAVVHGNHFDCHKKVVVTIVRSAEQIEISVWDQGGGFDLESLPDPRHADALLLPYGRGVYLARAFMDEFHVQSGPANGATVTMIKRIPFDEARRQFVE